MSPQNGKAACTSAEEHRLPRRSRSSAGWPRKNGSSCCSALRVMIQRPLTQRLAARGVRLARGFSLGYVLKESLASPKPLGAAAATARAPSAAAPVQRAAERARRPPRRADVGRRSHPPRRTRAPSTRCTSGSRTAAALGDAAVPDAASVRHIFNSADLWEDMWAEMGRGTEGGDLQRERRGAARQAVAALHRQAPPVQGLPQQRHVGVRQAHQRTVPVGTARGRAILLAAGAILRRSAQFSTPPCSLQAPRRSRGRSTLRSERYFNVDGCKEGGSILVHTSALPTIRVPL